MASERVTIFTNAMRTNFIDAFSATAEPTPIDLITEKIASSQRFEHYPWMSPVPGLSAWKGHRNFGKIGTITYKVPNLEYNSAFEVLLRDVEDDQVGGYMKKPDELAAFAKVLPNQLVLQAMANGTDSTLGKCFDDTAFYANSHTIGSGDNLMSGTAAASDGVTHKMTVSVISNSMKPFIFQDRKPPKFDTDADTPTSSMSKVIRYWIDLECNVAYGFWWNSIHVSYSNTPTLTEIQTDLGLIENQFQSFQLPSALTGDQPQYIHTQLQHNQNNTIIACSPKLKNPLRQVLSSAQILASGAAVTNVYENFASLVVNPYFS